MTDEEITAALPPAIASPPRLTDAEWLEVMRELHETWRTPDALGLDLVRAWSRGLTVERGLEEELEWIIFTAPDGRTFAFDAGDSNWDAGESPYAEIAATTAAERSRLVKLRDFAVSQLTASDDDAAAVRVRLAAVTAALGEACDLAQGLYEGRYTRDELTEAIVANGPTPTRIAELRAVGGAT